MSATVDVLAVRECSECGSSHAMNSELSRCTFCLISGIVKSAKSFHRLAQTFRRQFGRQSSKVAYCRHEVQRRMQNVRRLKRTALARCKGEKA